MHFRPRRAHTVACIIVAHGASTASQSLKLSVEAQTLVQWPFPCQPAVHAHNGPMTAHSGGRTIPCCAESSKGACAWTRLAHAHAPLRTLTLAGLTVATPCWPAPVSAMMRRLVMRLHSRAWPRELLILCAPVWFRSSRLKKMRGWLPSALQHHQNHVLELLAAAAYAQHGIPTTPKSLAPH